MENGRNLYQHIKNAIQFLLSGNFGAILVVLCASVAGLPVPFAPVHLLFINLLTDSLPAIALGVEPHSKAVMEQRPRPMSEVNPYKAISAEYRNGRSEHRRNDDGCIPDRIHKPECSSCKYDGIRNLMHEPSGAWI